PARGPARRSTSASSGAWPRPWTAAGPTLFSVRGLRRRLRRRDHRAHTSVRDRENSGASCHPYTLNQSGLYAHGRSVDGITPLYAVMFRDLGSPAAMDLTLDGAWVPTNVELMMALVAPCDRLFWLCLLGS